MYVNVIQPYYARLHLYCVLTYSYALFGPAQAHVQMEGPVLVVVYLEVQGMLAHAAMDTLGLHAQLMHARK